MKNLLGSLPLEKIDPHSLRSYGFPRALQLWVRPFESFPNYAKMLSGVVSAGLVQATIAVEFWVQHPCHVLVILFHSNLLALTISLLPLPECFLILDCRGCYR